MEDQGASVAKFLGYKRKNEKPIIETAIKKKLSIYNL